MNSTEKVATSKMLINANWDFETRLAVIDKNGKLVNLDIEGQQSKSRKKGNIHVGEITDIQQHLEAVFVRYSLDGEVRHGFLPFKEIAERYLAPKGDGDKPLGERLKPGDKLLVQIIKDERGTKGAALSSFISLPGTYLVLMVDSTSANGISKRVDQNEREQMKEALTHLKTPENMSVILRTAAMGKTHEELQWDLDNLLTHWQSIEAASKDADGPKLIHSEGSSVIRAIRDLLRHDIGSIIVDDFKTYEMVKQYTQMVRPQFADCVQRHNIKLPIFSYYQIESMVEELFAREVNLPSGGKLYIDKTEALTACDVNSARSTRGSDIEATALTTNIEAAEVVAEQIRLRDVGGIIVIDFIDMNTKNNRQQVEHAFNSAIAKDLARIKTVPICQTTGCLLLIRQKMGSTISDSIRTYQERSIESFCSHMMRIIEQNLAGISHINQIQIQLSMQTATYLLNEKRHLINQLESSYSTSIIIIPNNSFQREEFQIKTLKNASLTDSYKNMTTSKKSLYEPSSAMKSKGSEKPSVVPSISRQYPNQKKGAFKTLVDWISTPLRSTESNSKTKKASDTAVRSERGHQHSQSHQRNRRSGSSSTRSNHHNRRRRSSISRGGSKVKAETENYTQ